MAKIDKGHSPIGASSMYRWGNCPGSVRLSKGLESTSSEYAKEGTKAHEIAAYYLINGRWPSMNDVSSEMQEAIQVYINGVMADKADCDSTYNGNLFLVEHGFDLSEIHPEAWGTSDCTIYNVKKKLLIVWDYKHGAGIFVDVEDNDQLKYYALGALLSLKDIIVNDISLKICQPRFGNGENPIREYKFKTIEILDFMADLEVKTKATDDPKAPLKPGQWCRFCPACAVCPEVAQTAMTVAKTIFKPTETYDAQLLADTLDKLPILEAFASQVREFAYGEAMKGRVPPGYKVVQKRATRKWKEPAGIGKFLSKNLDSIALRACYTEPELRSPAQVEKLVPKEKKEQLGIYIIAESSGYKLAHNTDAGEPVLLDTKSIFEHTSLFE